MREVPLRCVRDCALLVSSVRSLRVGNQQQRHEGLEPDSAQHLGEHVGNVLSGLDVFQSHFPGLHMIANEVVPDVDVLRLGVRTRILAQPDATGVVLSNHGGVLADRLELREQQPQPESFGHSQRSTPPRS